MSIVCRFKLFFCHTTEDEEFLCFGLTSAICRRQLGNFVKSFGHFIDQENLLILKVVSRLMDDEGRNGWLQPPVKVPLNTLPSQGGVCQENHH